MRKRLKGSVTMVRGWQKVPWILQWILAHAAAFAIAAGMSFAMVADGNFNDVLWVLFLSALFSGGCSGSVEAGLLRRMLRYPGWWVAATILATPLGVALGAISAAFLFNAGLENVGTFGGPILGGLIFGTPVGAVVGAAQWVFLRSHLQYARVWIIFAAIGRGLGWALGLAVGSAANFPTVGLSAAFAGGLGGVIYGAITGSCFLRLRMKKRDG